MAKPQLTSEGCGCVRNINISRHWLPHGNGFETRELCRVLLDEVGEPVNELLSLRRYEFQSSVKTLFNR